MSRPLLSRVVYRDVQGSLQTRERYTVTLSKVSDHPCWLVVAGPDGIVLSDAIPGTREEAKARAMEVCDQVRCGVLK